MLLNGRSALGLTILLFALQFGPTSGCLLKFDQARTKASLDDPLFLGDSIEKLLQLCRSEPKINRFPEGEEGEVATSCEHREAVPPRHFTKAEIYFLQQAQVKLKSQQRYVRSVFRGLVSWLLFLIPLGMTIYLILVGHFDHRQFTRKFFNFKTTFVKPTGLIYSQLIKFMKTDLRPKSHWFFKGMDKTKFNWLKYAKWDAKFDPRPMKAFKKFKFLDRTHVTRYLDDEELHARKKNLLKEGWDFMILDRKVEEPILVTDIGKTQPEVEDEAVTRGFEVPEEIL